jgi:hypothetical protein
VGRVPGATDRIAARIQDEVQAAFRIAKFNQPSRIPRDPKRDGRFDASASVIGADEAER